MEATAQGNAIRVVTACALGTFFSAPTLLIYPFGLFVIAIAEETGLPRQALAAAIGPALLLTILMYPLSGWIIQRFHKPTVAVLSVVGAACGLLVLAATPASSFSFAVTLAIAIVLSALATPGISMALIADTFDRGRGFAIGAVLAFSGLGVALLPLVDSWMIEHWGWRAAYVGAACAVFAVALINMLLLRGVASRDPALRGSKGVPVTELVRNPTFWLIVGFFFFLVVVANAVPLHLPLILAERGASPEIRTLSLTVIGLAMIVSRPLLGFVLDRLPTRAVLALMVAGPLGGSLCLLLFTGTVASLAAAAGFGLTIGGEFVCLGYIVSRTYPLEHFGSVYGWASTGLGLGIAVGPNAVSALVKLSGNYGAALRMMVVMSALALFFGFFLNATRLRDNSHNLHKGV